MKLKLRVIKNWRDPAQFVMPLGNFIDNQGHRGRRYLSHEDAPFRTEAFTAFGITEFYPEPFYKNFIGNHYLDGAFTHEHSDTAPEGFAHVRCNWMVKKPPVGGDPILDGEVVSVEEGDLWLCIASMERHGTTPIAGGERLIYSFGALVKSENLRHILSGN
jgi:hypothetical protein